MVLFSLILVVTEDPAGSSARTDQLAAGGGDFRRGYLALGMPVAGYSLPVRQEMSGPLPLGEPAKNIT